MDNNGLREQVMINQFVLAAGCPREQAAQILTQAGWQFQTALSIYFQEAAIPKNTAGFSLITPANTPATPPNFPDALTMFSNMSTSDKMATSPKGGSAVSPRATSHFHGAMAATSPKNQPMLSPLPPPGHHEVHHHWRGQQHYQQSFSPTPNNSIGRYRDQQQQVQTSDASNFHVDGNFLAMEMEGVPHQ